MQQDSNWGHTIVESSANLNFAWCSVIGASQVLHSFVGGGERTTTIMVKMWSANTQFMSSRPEVFSLGVGEGLLGVRKIKKKSKTSSIISLTGQNYIN
jgi:hypothetical protein